MCDLCNEILPLPKNDALKARGNHQGHRHLMNDCKAVNAQIDRNVEEDAKRVGRRKNTKFWDSRKLTRIRAIAQLIPVIGTKGYDCQGLCPADIVPVEVRPSRSCPIPAFTVIGSDLIISGYALSEH